MLLLTKEPSRVIRYLIKSDVNDLLMIRGNRLQNTSDSLKKLYFCMFLTVFPLFYAQERIAHIDLRSFALF